MAPIRLLFHVECRQKQGKWNHVHKTLELRPGDHGWHPMGWWRWRAL